MHIWFLFRIGWAYPSNFWHFNSLSAPGPGLTVFNGNVTEDGTLLMDGSAVYGHVSSSIVLGGEMTIIFRLFPTDIPQYSRVIDFGNGKSDNIILYWSGTDNDQIFFHVGRGDTYVRVHCGGIFQLNQWNTIAIQFKFPNLVFGTGSRQINSGCAWSGMHAPMAMVRSNQYIGKSNWEDPGWTGQLDFVWHIGRALNLAERTVITYTEGDIMANAWTFQSLSNLPSTVSLFGNPDITGGKLTIHSNSSARINSTIGGPFSIAARVRLNSYQSWARIIDFSNDGADGVYVSALGTSGLASVAVERGTQSQTLTCERFWKLGQWADIFLKISNNNIQISNGQPIVCRTSSSWDLTNATRSQLWIGKSSSGDGGWDGALQYLALFPRVLDILETNYLSTVYQSTNYLVGSQFTAFDSRFIGIGSPTLTNDGRVYLSGLASQYIQVSSSVVLSTPFTISTRMYAEVERTNLSIFEFGNGLNQDNVILAQDGNTSNLFFRVTNNVGSTTLYCANLAVYGEWMQVTLVHDGSTAYIYSSGGLSCSGSMLAVPLVTRRTQYIGKSIDPTHLTWQGYFDYFLLYDRALTADEALFNALELDRNNVLCGAASLSSPRANVGTCVAYARQGTTCKLACNSPYIELSSVPGVCTTIPNAESAAWVLQSINCIAQCSSLKAPIHGSVSCSGPYGPVHEDATCSFECSIGFTLVGSNVITCTAAGGGSWTGVPTCVAVTEEPGLTPGMIVVIVLSLLLLLLGVMLYWIRKDTKTKRTAKIRDEFGELSKDPREVALNNTIQLCEQALKKPKISGQNKLFLQSIIFGAKEDKDVLSQAGSYLGVELTHVQINGAQEQPKVFNGEDFERVKFLSRGEGGTAELYKEKNTGKLVVIKVPHHLRELEAEVKIWRSVGLHPNVARMIGIVNLNNKPQGIIMEYYPGGSLDSTDQEFSSKELLRIATDLARGLQCLHDHKVIHRDLAARNILMAQDRRAAITDFGLSRQLDKNDSYLMISATRLPWRTLAPEWFLQEDGEQIFTEKTDIWALGVTLWELATKRSAYAEFEESFQMLKQKIGNGTIKLDLTPIIMDHAHLAAALVGCLNRDPALRPNAEQLRWLLKDDNSAEVTDRENYIAAVRDDYAAI